MTEDEARRAAHKEILLELTPVEWASFRHHPIMAAYLQFLDDQAANWREYIMDSFEIGQMDLEGPNAIETRGRILALKELRDLELTTIHAFYGAQEPAPEDEQA